CDRYSASADGTTISGLGRRHVNFWNGGLLEVECRLSTRLAYAIAADAGDVVVIQFSDGLGDADRTLSVSLGIRPVRPIARFHGHAAPNEASAFSPWGTYLASPVLADDPPYNGNDEAALVLTSVRAPAA